MLTNEEYLSLSDLVKKIGIVKSTITMRSWVEKDLKENNLLKPIIIGEGEKKRYYFKQENVDEFLSKLHEGKAFNDQTELQ